MRKFIHAFKMLTGSIIILAAQSCSNDSSPPLHQQRLEIGRALLEVQAPNVDEVLPYYTDDIEYHDPIVDIEGIENMTAFLNQLIIEASPNLVTTIEDETLIGDIYSATWIMSRDFLDVPYQAKGISILSFAPILHKCTISATTIQKAILWPPSPAWMKLSQVSEPTTGVPSIPPLTARSPLNPKTQR